MSTTISKKTAMRGLLLISIVIGCVVDRVSIMRYQQELDAKNQAKIEEKRTLEAEETQAQRLQRESDIALERAKQGCVLVIYTQNNKPARFRTDARVFDAQTFPTDPKAPRFDKMGNPLNGVKPMPTGVKVCNTFGDTAIVGDDGYLTQIYRVETSKLSEFRSNF
jgi:hypothetical protein